MSNSNSYPPPDTFLLELLDQVQLAFPTLVEKAQVHFKRIEQEPLRVALTDLQGEPSPDALPRISLGHQDADVLDTINAIISDLALSVRQHGSVDLNEGYWDIFPDPTHGGVHVFLVEKTKKENIIRMKRVFDQSELSWLLFTKAFYEKINGAIDEIQQQQKSILPLSENVQRFSVDMKSGILFIEKEKEDHQLKIQLIGSWLQDTGGYLWGWANPNCPPATITAINNFKTQHSTPGLRAFYKPELGAPEPMADLLSAYAAHALAFQGVYKAPFQSEHGKGFMYLGVLKGPYEVKAEKDK